MRIVRNAALTVLLVLLVALAGPPRIESPQAAERFPFPDIRGLPLEVASVEVHSRGFFMLIFRDRRDCPYSSLAGRRRPCKFPVGVVADDFVVSGMMSWEPGDRVPKGSGYVVYVQASESTPRDNFILSSDASYRQHMGVGNAGTWRLRLSGSKSSRVCLHLEGISVKDRARCFEDWARSDRLPLFRYTTIERGVETDKVVGLLPPGWSIKVDDDMYSDTHEMHTIAPPVGFQPSGLRLVEFAYVGGPDMTFTFTVRDGRGRKVQAFEKTGAGELQQVKSS